MGRYYLPQLDVLRFGAFGLVFVSHSFPSDVETWRGLGLGEAAAPVAVALVHAGAFGVDLFFVLSAYLITALLMREREARGDIDLKAFYWRRGLRIWPLYYAAVLAFFGLQFVLADEVFTGRYLAAYLAFAGNWACVLWGFPQSAAAPLWSVGFEEQFYLTWPWLMRRLSPAAMGWICAGLIGFSVALRACLGLAHARHEALWCNSLARLDPIALGVLLALRPPRIAKGAAGWIAGACLAGLVVTGTADGLSGAALTPAWTYLAAALCSAGLVAACLGMDYRPGVAGRPLVYLGKVSFGLYVFHLAAIRIFDVLAPGEGAVAAAARVAVPFAASIAAAALSYAVLETPFLKLKARFTYVESRPV